jgi:glutaredoxin
MKKNVFIMIIGLLILLAISAFIAIRYSPNIFIIPAASKTINQTKSTSSEIIFFYGNGCPHCAKVEQYLSDNKVEDKISFEKKEIYSNQDNAALLIDKAHSCGMNTDSIGVPFLWDGPTGKCISGDEDVINYFQQKLSQ